MQRAAAPAPAGPCSVGLRVPLEATVNRLVHPPAPHLPPVDPEATVVSDAVYDLAHAKAQLPALRQHFLDAVGRFDSEHTRYVEQASGVTARDLGRVVDLRLGLAEAHARLEAAEAQATPAGAGEPQLPAGNEVATRELCETHENWRRIREATEGAAVRPVWENRCLFGPAVVPAGGLVPSTEGIEAACPVLQSMQPLALLGIAETVRGFL
mmetsp:Transcript_131763/g.299599  ORF Transcript_131763/g.299599 Transcript_131763/m.299599 type:complete len:211 (+) Transcript_131763:825-1457(+)